MKRRFILTRLRQRLFGEVERAKILIELINKHKYKTYAEIGVWEGYTAEKIAKNCHLTKIILVDPYDSNIEYKGGTLYEKGEQKKVNEAKKMMLSKMKKFDNVTYLYIPSVKASKNFKDKSLDVVFIDGLHTYSAVKDDIISWLPKISTGGMISGHDYNNRYKEHVVKAVDEFFPKKKILLYDDGVWVVKKLNK